MPVMNLSQAEAYFKIHAVNVKSVYYLELELINNTELTDTKRSWMEDRIDFLNNLINGKVIEVDRILHILRHISQRAKLINFNIIKNETDVIIHFEDNPKPGKW